MMTDQWTAWQKTEARVYSQNGEDGVIAALLERIGCRSRYFVEIGVGDGRECNCRLLKAHDWHGMMFDRDHGSKSDDKYSDFVRVAVTMENVIELLVRCAVPRTFDVFSLDIDGNEFYVAGAMLERFAPRIVVIEYTAQQGPDAETVIRYDPDHRWDGSDYHGASARALSLLAKLRGYEPVYVEKRGVNMFWVRADEVERCDLKPLPIDQCHRPISGRKARRKDAKGRSWVSFADAMRVIECRLNNTNER